MNKILAFFLLPEFLFFGSIIVFFGGMIIIGVSSDKYKRVKFCDSIRYQLSQGKKLDQIKRYSDETFGDNNYYIRNGYLYSYNGNKFCKKRVE